MIEEEWKVRHYYIYLIEEEFASHYFGRESKIFHLFRDFHWTTVRSNHNDILERQINFITRPIPMQRINQLFKTNLANRILHSKVNHVHKIELDGRGHATITVKKRCLELISSGSYETETVFFEVLRKFDPCFLAMDLNGERYGWLNPIKERNFV